MAPVIAFDQVNFFVNVWLLQVKVSVISPVITAAPPRVAFFATVIVNDPSADAVAALLFPDATDIPEGSVEYDTVQAALVVPIYPAKGITMVLAAVTNPPNVHGIETASFPHTTDVADVPLVPFCPVAPVSDFAHENFLTCV